MFKFDIERCFDSISHGRIFKILDFLMEHCPDQLMIKKYDVLSMSNDQIKKSFRKYTCKINEISQFEELIKRNCDRFDKSMIFVDKVNGIFCDKIKIFDMIKDHVGNNKILLENIIYRQGVGLPQGSVLSTLICSYVYGHFDQLYFQEFIQNPKCLLMRYIDDYILISTEKSLVNKFINAIGKKSQLNLIFIVKDDSFDSDFGFRVNVSKCHSSFYNIKTSYQIKNNHDESKFHWCGFDINVLDLSTSAHLEKFFGTCMNIMIKFRFNGFN